MLEYIPLGLALGALALLLVAPWFGWERTLLTIFLGASVIAPWPLVLVDGVHYGITTGQLVPTTYSVALVALAAISLTRRGQRIPWSWYVVAMAIFFAAWMAVAWNGTPNQWSGVSHMMLATIALALAFGIGARSRADASLEASLVKAATTLIVIELLLVVVQLSGFAISIYPELQYFLGEGRPLGSFNHPSTLGKFVAILQLPLLIAASGAKADLRRWAWLGILAGIPATALTQSRANTLAVVAAIVIWLVLSRNDTLRGGRRLGGFVAISVVAVPGLNVALERFAVDASGGDRASLLSVGLSQIARTPLVGTGPNNYVEVVGIIDATTAAGYPIHVAPLLSIAELGFVGGVLFWLPPFVVLVQALHSFGAGTASRSSATAYVATFPGLMLIAFTGWGVLSASTLAVWWFVIGYASGKMTKTAQDWSLTGLDALELDERRAVPRA